MPVLAQTFFTLVRRHLVTLMLLSVGHIIMNLKLFVHYLLDEAVSGLESGDVVSGDHDSGLLGDVTGGLLSAMLDDEAAETTKIHILIFGYRFDDCLHESFNNCLHLSLLKAGVLGDLVYDVCLCHFCKYLITNFLPFNFWDCKNRVIFLEIKDKNVNLSVIFFGTMIDRQRETDFLLTF